MKSELQRAGLGLSALERALVKTSRRKPGGPGGGTKMERFKKRYMRRPPPAPTPAQIHDARADAKLSAKIAANLIYRTERAWQHWEGGTRVMPTALWELFQLKALIGGHEAFDALLTSKTK